MKNPFGVSGLMEWLNLVPGDDRRLMATLRPAVQAIVAPLHEAGLDQRQAAFMVIQAMAAVLAAQDSPTDRDRLMSEALLALDRVREEWAQAQAGRRPRSTVH